MKVDVAKAARERLSSALDLVDSLQAGTFPHPDSRKALLGIEDILKSHLAPLDRLDGESEESVVFELCENVSLTLHEYLPFLGFLYRSRKPYNAFEFYGPLLRIAQDIIGPDTKLILSSEWHYSPFTYVPLTDLPNFVWVGLPASESSNALLTPLAGHEFGHSVWAVRNLSKLFRPTITESFFDYLMEDEHWKIFVQSYPEADTSQDPAELLSDASFGQRTWEAQRWAINQCEEVFCDLIGLRVFGESYLHAFAYVLAPGNHRRGSYFYPSLEDRVSHLVDAAERFSISVPSGFRDAFVPRDPADSTEILLAAADQAVRSSLEDIIEEVDRLGKESSVPQVTQEEVDASLSAFKLLVPDNDASSLPQLINAGWRVENDEDMWSDYTSIKDRKQVLNQLLLKSAQVLEFNLRVEEGNQGHDSPG